MGPEEIRRHMRQLGLKQVDVARAIGLDAIKMSLVMSGKRRLQAHELDKLRELFAVSPSTLGGVPIIGLVPGGNLREAIRNPRGYMPRPDPSIPSNAFALEVEGDSMDLVAEEGTKVVVDPDDKALFPKRYYVVMVDGESTFKQFMADPARLVPCSSNPKHTEIPLGEGLPFEIVGRVIWRANRM